MANPKLYSSANGMQRKDAEDVVREFCARMLWTEKANVVDIGCGTGDVTAGLLLPRLPHGFSHLVGLDLSEEMIEHARRVHGQPKLSFVQFDIAQESDNILRDLTTKLENNNIPEANNNLAKGRSSSEDLRIVSRNPEEEQEPKFVLHHGFDVASSFYCLHWIRNQRLALSNIYRLLKPGGEALLVLLAKSPIFSLYDKLSVSPTWGKYMQDVENFISPYHRSEDPLQDFLRVAEEVGFESIKSECRERSYVFQSNSNLRNAIIAVNPFVSRIPNHLQGEYVSECMRQVEEMRLTEAKNNCHKIAYRLLVAHMRKPANPD